MITALENGRILTDTGFIDGSVLIEDGLISAVFEGRAPRAAIRHDLGGLRLVPGFIDTQVNGGGGLLFNDSPTVESVARIGAAHRRFGTTGFLPTLISDDLDTVSTAISAVDAAIEAGTPGVLGIHIEGPFLSSRRKGVHDASKFRTLDDAALPLISSLKRGKTLITLAPETTTPGMIAKLVETGAIVAAGHTNASFKIIRQALDAGLRGFTHLFNAMSPLTSREAGVVGAALDDQDSWCGLIVDGRHVDPVVMRIALRAKRNDRFMLVTDAMPNVGSGEQDFMLQGRQIRVVDGVCLDQDGTLAGSALDMSAAVRNAVSMLDLSLEDAVRMASRSPAGFLGVADHYGELRPGYRADLVLLDQAGVVSETWIGGLASKSLA